MVDIDPEWEADDYDRSSHRLMISHELQWVLVRVFVTLRTPHGRGTPLKHSGASLGVSYTRLKSTEIVSAMIRIETGRPGTYIGIRHRVQPTVLKLVSGTGILLAPRTGDIVGAMIATDHAKAFQHDHRISRKNDNFESRHWSNFTNWKWITVMLMPQIRLVDFISEKITSWTSMNLRSHL